MVFPFSEASWIWSHDHAAAEINATFEFEREFIWSGLSQVHVAIFADSRYRLSINGEWVMDGPARGYPDYGFYDNEEVTAYLRSGPNRIMIAVVHYGVDTFQYIRANAGVVAAFYQKEGKPPLLVTDGSWMVRRAIEWIQRTPRICPQLGFEEHFDARIPRDGWSSAVIVHKSPGDLLPRTTGRMSQVTREITKRLRIDQVRGLDKAWTLALRRHLSPFPKGINLHGMAGVLVTQLRTEQELQLQVYLLGPVEAIFVDGQPITLESDQDLKRFDLVLAPGCHQLSLGICTEYDHATELAIGYVANGTIEWKNPVSEGATNWASTGPLWSSKNDTNCLMDHSDMASTVEQQLGGAFLVHKQDLLQKVLQIAAALDLSIFEPIAPDMFSEADAYLALRTDRLVGDARTKSITVAPAIRQLFDLGEMTIGYVMIEFEAPSGAIIDGYCFEHLHKDEIQYLYQYDGISYRNSFRITAREGKQYFLSRQRRGFRYLQLVCRGADVRFHSIRVVESTYAPNQVGKFDCSDDQLTRIYEVSQRTLLLCMEDVYTDCPSYEQVLWLDAARYEALFSYYAFGAEKLAEHTWRLAAHSLKQQPLVASQCPSGWNVQVPSLSFLWGIAVWETYWQTGNKSFLEELYPALKSNLEVALRYCTNQGLLSVSAWNFFDWAAIDQNQKTVLHNSMLLAAALDCGCKAAMELGYSQDKDFFHSERERLVGAINLMWDSSVGSYRDVRLANGEPGPGTSQHTSFLALLYGLIPPEFREQAIQNCLHPPESMATVGSPATMFCLLEALCQAGHSREVLMRMQKYWGRMLDRGATTFWEVVESRVFWKMMNLEGCDFPTRSHCHGWAASPVYLFVRIFLGIEVVQPGWREVVLRPNLHGLEYVTMDVCTPLGLLHAELRACASGKTLKLHAPIGMKVTIEPESNFSLL